MVGRGQRHCVARFVRGSSTQTSLRSKSDARSQHGASVSQHGAGLCPSSGDSFPQDSRGIASCSQGSVHELCFLDTSCMR